MVTNKKKSVKRANLNTRISLNTFRGASTPAEVRALLRHHRIGVHPNKYVTDHNRRRATEQTHKLTVAANKRLAELTGGWTAAGPGTPTGWKAGAGNLVRRAPPGQRRLPYNLRVSA